MDHLTVNLAGYTLRFCEIIGFHSFHCLKDKECVLSPDLQSG